MTMETPEGVYARIIRPIGKATAPPTLSDWLIYLGQACYEWAHLKIDQRGNNGEPHYVYIQVLRIPREHREQGYGKAIMRGLCEVADANGWALTVTPSTDYGATSLTRIRGFFQRFGFVPNRGKRRDFTSRSSMIRPAHSVTTGRLSRGAWWEAHNAAYKAGDGDTVAWLEANRPN